VFEPKRSARRDKVEEETTMVKGQVKRAADALTDGYGKKAESRKDQIKGGTSRMRSQRYRDRTSVPTRAGCIFSRASPFPEACPSQSSTRGQAWS
jgi:uncharacterized protein YjbJ (UPF0337 family)